MILLENNQHQDATRSCALRHTTLSLIFSPFFPTKASLQMVYSLHIHFKGLNVLKGKYSQLVYLCVCTQYIPHYGWICSAVGSLAPALQQ